MLLGSVVKIKDIVVETILNKTPFVRAVRAALHEVKHRIVRIKIYEGYLVMIHLSINHVVGMSDIRWVFRIYDSWVFHLSVEAGLEVNLISSKIPFQLGLQLKASA
jgi:hypothetical protein